MPVDLALVRHGQSEGNVATHATESGDDRYVRDEHFRLRHSSRWRLTELGAQQAQAAGRWIVENIGPDFDRYYVSSFTRAVETAAHLELPGARWYIEPLLREREYGTEDLLTAEQRAALADSARVRQDAPLYWRPLGGESIADVTIRLRFLLDTFHRELPTGRVIVVCHGDVMRAFRVLLERLTDADFAAWVASVAPADRLRNGQVFHYTRRDPETGEIAPYLGWWRSISTSDPSSCDPRWREVNRPAFDNGSLLELAECTPRLIIR